MKPKKKKPKMPAGMVKRKGMKKPPSPDRTGDKMPAMSTSRADAAYAHMTKGKK